MRMSECPHCGSELTAESRFCPECGRPVTAAATAPIRVGSRWPPDALLLISLLVMIGGIVLLAGGVWAWGLVAVFGGLALFFARGEMERRTAGNVFAKLRARAGAAGVAVAAHSREQVALFRARRELVELEAQRGRAFQDLGRAVFVKDKAGKETAQAAVEAIEARIGDKEAEIETLRRKTEARVGQAQAHGRATARLEMPPEPARIPEPYPPPDEGTPPQPVPSPAPGEPVPGPDEPSPPEQPATPGGTRTRRRRR